MMILILTIFVLEEKVTEKLTGSVLVLQHSTGIGLIWFVENFDIFSGFTSTVDEAKHAIPWAPFVLQVKIE